MPQEAFQSLQDRICGLMGARFLFVTGWGLSPSYIAREHLLAPAQDRVLGVRKFNVPRESLSTSDFQSEVGEVFGKIGGELPAKFARRFSSFFCWGKSSEAFSTKTPPQISPSNFTTRFWVVAGPKSLKAILKLAGYFHLARLF